MYFYTFATIGSLKPFISKICFRIFPRITILSSYCCFVVFSLFSFQGAVPCNIRWYCVVGLNGFEPSTSRLSGVRSNHLSYKPIYKESISLVEMRRIELLTPCLQGRCSPSWATPPYEIDSFFRDIAPSKLNNVCLKIQSWIDLGIYEILSQISWSP